MKHYVTGAAGALVLTAGLVFAQQPPASPTPTPPAGSPPATQIDQTPGNGGTTSRQVNSQVAVTTRTYNGCLAGTTANGYTITTMDGANTAGRRGGASSATTTTTDANGNTTIYTVTPGASRADLATMVNKRVEIMGTVAAASSNTAGSSEVPSASATASATNKPHQSLTVSTIRVVPGTCP